MPAIIRKDSTFLPPGKVRRDLIEPFLTGTLPSWLTVAQGTGAYVSPGSVGGVPNTPGYQVTTAAATVGSQAQLAGAFSIKSTNVAAIMWTMEGFRADTTAYNANADFAMTLYGSSVGGWYEQKKTQTQGEFVANGATRLITPIGHDMWSTTTEAQTSRNLSLLLHTKLQEIWLLEDDQIVAQQSVASANWATGNVTPQITLTTEEAVSHSFTVSQVKLTIWTD